jgi:hypothetical protein
MRRNTVWGHKLGLFRTAKRATYSLRSQWGFVFRSVKAADHLRSFAKPASMNQRSNRFAPKIKMRLPLGEPFARLLFPPTDDVSFLRKSIRCELRNLSLP